MYTIMLPRSVERLYWYFIIHNIIRHTDGHIATPATAHGVKSKKYPRQILQPMVPMSGGSSGQMAALH